MGIFVDREREVKTIVDFIEGSSNQVLHITGLHGVGKTTVVKKALSETSAKSVYISSYDSKTHILAEKSINERADDFYYLFFMDRYPFDMEVESSFLKMMRKFAEENVSVVVIDDAHFLSEFGAQFIVYAALSEEVKIIVVTRKDLYNKSIIKNAIERIRRENLLGEMHLEPLAEDEIVKIFREHLEAGISQDYIKWLLDCSKGNIHYINFLLKGEINPDISIPEKIKEMYMHLGDEERKILGYLSLVRKPIDMDAFVSLTSIEEDKILFLLDELSEAGWIYEEDNSFFICSTEIAKYAYEMLDEKTKIELHRKLGEYYLSTGDIRSAAYHFKYCDRERYIETLEKCAQKAWESYSFSEAERYYRELYHLTHKNEYLKNLLEILLFSAKNREFGELISEAPETDEFNILRVIYYARTGDIRRAMKYAVKCSNGDDLKIRILGNIWMAYIFRIMDLEEIAQDILQKSFEESKRINYLEGQIYSKIYLGLAKYNLGDKNGVDDLYYALKLAENTRLRYLAAVNLTDVLIAENRLVEAEKILMDMLAEARKHYMGFEEKLIVMNLAYLLAKKGLIKEAIEDFLELKEYLEERNYGFLLAQVYARLGDCYQWADDYETAMKYYKKAFETAQEYGYPKLIKSSYLKVKSLREKAGSIKTQKELG